MLVLVLVLVLVLISDLFPMDFSFSCLHYMYCITWPNFLGGIQDKVALGGLPFVILCAIESDNY